MVRSVQHEMLAVPTADETARQQFVVAFKQALNRGLRKTQGELFETVVAPGWAAEHGTQPTTRESIREAMQADPAYRSWSSLARPTSSSGAFPCGSGSTAWFATITRPRSPCR